MIEVEVNGKLFLMNRYGCTLTEEPHETGGYWSGGCFGKPIGTWYRPATLDEWNAVQWQLLEQGYRFTWQGAQRVWNLAGYKKASTVAA